MNKQDITVKIQKKVEEFEKVFYEDTHYMMRGMIAVGVKCKMPPIEAIDWLTKAFTSIAETVSTQVRKEERERIAKAIEVIGQKQWEEQLDSEELEVPYNYKLGYKTATKILFDDILASLTPQVKEEKTCKCDDCNGDCEPECLDCHPEGSGK